MAFLPQYPRRHTPNNLLPCSRLRIRNPALFSPTHSLAAAVESRSTQARARLRQLVEIESPSENKAAVDRAAELVRGWAEDLGAKAKLHRQKEFGDLLELRFGPRRRSSPPPLLLLGHLDTVWPMGTLAHMPWRESSGKLYGPGVLDMKAGVVMALEALTALHSTGQTPPPVTLLLVSEEEIGSPVSRPVTEQLAQQSSTVFVLEPAQGLAYKTARKGVGHFELRVEGVAAHSGVDFSRGHSAILEMARLVEQVSNFTDLKRGHTVNVGVIAGGTRSNVVAASCRAEVDVRIVRASDAATVQRMFARLRTADKACRLTISGGINRPPMERSAATVKLFHQARSLAKELGFVLEEAMSGGGSDGNFTAALGIPTLDGMGAVGAGAHADDEHIVAAHLNERTALLAAMIAQEH